MTKISHISWGGYDKGFYGSTQRIRKTQSDNIDIQALEYKLRVLSLNTPSDGNHF